MKFSNTYHQLDSKFFQHEQPTPVADPQLLLWNNKLAESLQISQELAADSDLLAQYFSGNQLPVGAEPIALAYSGHQFGQFNGQLGDGRAHLLGEILDNNNSRYDIQLKGSGPTSFSRRGDGRCALAPALREYIMSEAMYALGVPTSRCLAVVASGEVVYRETPKPGAIVTRVAASHIRVGTFQYFAAQGDIESLATLTDYAIKRHFADIDLNADDKVVLFLEAVLAKQIELIVAWMRVGFIHGVMNTDNNSISGETIDFGPCAMMGAYHPDTVYSSIDRQGRYAFANQPPIAQWNMARLAECLLLLMPEEQEQALAKVEPIIAKFTDDFALAYDLMMANKLGFAKSSPAIKKLITDLLDLLQDQQLDYTETFAHLGQSLTDATLATQFKVSLANWYSRWLSELDNEQINILAAQRLMQNNNPLVIPRNHHVEALLMAAEQDNDMQAIADFIAVLRAPYQQLPQTHKYQDLPLDGDRNYQTFCGT